ncbi:MAG: GNAT family N-acetyltransferase [Pseudomonadota bacterium]
MPYDQDALLDALRATWPPARVWSENGLTHADGAGGGKRVSASRLNGPLAHSASALLQAPLVQVPDGAHSLEMHLGQSHDILDPTALYAASSEAVAGFDPEIYVADAPIAAMRQLWAAGSVGAERLAVMERVKGPKAFLMSRDAGQLAGVAFVATSGDIGMLHAVHVAPRFRRAGHGRRLTRAAARWVFQHGGSTFALAVVRANTGAIALYEGLGMRPMGGYHYRALKQGWA